jgi:phosphate/sulfate permease
LPAPSARLTDDETPPPIAPDDIICVSMAKGNTTAMAASGSGLNKDTVRSIALAWVLTLPASIVLAGFLFWLFRHIF